MHICPKCGAFYAGGSAAFCLVDGMPLINVAPNSENWSEGSRLLAEKANTLRKLQRTLKWRRVIRIAATMLVTTTVVCVVAVNGLIKLKLLPIGPTLTPAPPVTAILPPPPTPTPTSTPIGAHVYKIKGRVTDQAKPLRDVRIKLEGPRLGAETDLSAITDANGNYTFSLLLEGSSYTITPAAPGMTFTPSTRVIKNLSRDESADFSILAHTDNYKISGRVTNETGNVRGITIKLGGARSQSLTTDTSGFYSFNDLPPGGSYTITPSKAKMSFTPVNRAVSNLTRDESADFTGLELFTISGRVTNQSRPLADVDIRLDGARSRSTTTDATGFYSFSDLPAGGYYSVTPHRTKVDFTPPSRPINNLASDVSADFTSLVQKEVFKISGRVTIQGRSVEGVSIQLRGTSVQLSAKTDGNGFYSFNDLPSGGRYTVAPGRSRVTFTPPSRLIKNLTRDEAADFDGLGQPDTTPLRFYKISGRVIFPGAVVSITLAGSAKGRTTTNAEGFYSFSNLAAGGNYTVTPESASARFRPGSRSFNNLARDESADFERVSPAGPTQTSSPTPACTDDDRKSVVRVIRAKFPRVALIKSSIETCTSTLIIVSCQWGARNERVPDRFKCEKSGREWQCQ